MFVLSKIDFSDVIRDRIYSYLIRNNIN